MDWMKVFRTAEISGAKSSVWLWLILVFAIFIPSSSAEQINITAVSGKNATLPCRVLDGNKTINGLEWSKRELETEYVFMYRDSKPDLTKQHQSFKNQVHLQDRQMKDGNVSLTLKSVTHAHAGIYEVRISPRTKHTKRAYLGSDPICIISLSVVDPPGLPIGLIIGLLMATAVLLFVAITGPLLIYRRRRKQNIRMQTNIRNQELDSSSSRSLDSLDTGLLS